MLPDTALAALEGAVPLTEPETSTRNPLTSRADPVIVPVTDAEATRRLRTSDEALPGTRTVAMSPDLSRSTLNNDVLLAGLSTQSEMDVQKPFWQTGTPAGEKVRLSVYGPLSRTTGRWIGTVVGPVRASWANRRTIRRRGERM